MVPFSRYLGIKRFVIQTREYKWFKQRVLRNIKISVGNKLPRNIESVSWLANQLINVLKKYFGEIHLDFDWVL